MDYNTYLQGYLHKESGIIRGIPDGTGPHGRGLGPGKGTRMCALGADKLRLVKKIMEMKNKSEKKKEESK